MVIVPSSLVLKIIFAGKEEVVDRTSILVKGFNVPIPIKGSSFEPLIVNAVILLLLDRDWET